MPQIETWSRLPAAIRAHLIERMHDRKISLDDLNQLRLWMEAKPEVPEGLWYKDFGSFKLCGEGRYPKTFLVAGQAAIGAIERTRAKADVSQVAHLGSVKVLRQGFRESGQEITRTAEGFLEIKSHFRL